MPNTEAMLGIVLGGRDIVLGGRDIVLGGRDMVLGCMGEDV